MPIRTIDSNTAHLKWKDLLDSAMHPDVDVVITRHGKPVAVVLAYDEFQAMVEELAELRAKKEVVEAYEEWKADPSTGEAWESVKAELGI